MPNPIIVDTRGEDETIEEINRLNFAPVIPKLLDCGDLAWFADGFQTIVGVERKRADDLLNSLPPSNRIEGQLSRMVEQYAIPILLIQGSVERQVAHIRQMGVDSRWTLDGIDDYLLSWQLAGVYVVRCGASGLGERIRLLYNWSQRRNHLARRRHRKLLWTGPATGRAEALAALVPGLGLTKAEALSQTSVAQLAARTPEEWKKINITGLGVAMKKKIYNALHTEEI